jgi:hypothetical protein
LRLRKGNSRKKLRLSDLKMLSFASKSVRVQIRRALRKMKSSKSMSVVPRNTLRSSESNLGSRKKTLQLSRISIRRCRKSTRGKWQPCKRSLPRKLKRWKFPSAVESSNLMDILLT